MAERTARTGFPDGYGFEAPPVRPGEYLVVDFETAGLSADAPIVEAACVRVRHRRIVGKWEALVALDGPMPPEGLAVHGITDEMLEAFGMEPEEAWREFAEFVGGKAVPMFAHNMPFDARAMFANGAADFMEADCPLCDSLLLSRRAYPEMEHHTLSWLSLKLGLVNPSPHRAAGDAACCAQLVDACYAALEERAGLPGQMLLSETLRYPECPRCASWLVARDGYNQAREQLFRCKECGKRYTDPQAEGMAPAPKVGGPSPLCPKCGHTRMHIKERRGPSVRYRCAKCGRSSSFKASEIEGA